ncbi:aminotransferase class V-fold PLP-dependent enzyme [Candidatus Vidania fulgoroideae]|uniref:cysteine desulfurase n=1 Tax=Candidatus Vidania fulgoroideorum TaxID=881286 RepID=A0A975ADQ6_9PROT|nr:aminotransferase class V-fold PLP-dependent enzyme [Candidatus Vidania fulgoroideae]
MQVIKPKYIFLNNAATTKIRKNIAKKIYKLEKYYLNKQTGKTTKIDKITRHYIKKVTIILKCTAKELIWTSGATESNNLVIKGLLKDKDNIITTNIEHDSILKTLKTHTGKILTLITHTSKSLTTQFKQIIQHHKIKLASICYVNNETGKINNIKKIAQICKQKQIILHIDATQAFGKININTTTTPVDLITISSHKIYGPKGIGLLYIKTPLINQITPLITGGQQQPIRAGTLSQQNIIGACAAIVAIKKDIKKCNAKITKLNKFMLNSLKKTFKNNFNYIKGKKIPHITCMWIKHLNSKILLHKLKPIIIANKAACNNTSTYSNKIKKLTQFNKFTKLTFRISIGKNNSYCEIENLIKKLIHIYTTTINPLLLEKQ